MKIATFNVNSVFDYRRPNAVCLGRGWRIDHVLAMRTLARKSTDTWIDLAPRVGERPSDHTFLVAEFDVGRRAA